MIEKSHLHHYHHWNHKQLNDKIMALYDQIEKATISNLQIAQKNSELQIQISTIDHVLKKQSATTTPNAIEQYQQSLEDQYGMLLDEHLKLVQRVSKIEQLLSAKKENQGQDKGRYNMLQRTSSIQNLMKNNRKKTIQKIKYEKRNTGSQLTRRDQTARKKYY